MYDLSSRHNFWLIKKFGLNLWNCVCSKEIVKRILIEACKAFLLTFKDAPEIDLDESDVGALFKDTNSNSTIPYIVVSGKVAAAQGTNLLQVHSLQLEVLRLMGLYDRFQYT